MTLGWAIRADPRAAGSYRDGTLLQHPAGLVVEVGELHRHLVVDGQQQVLPGLQLALQLLAVLVGELRHSCRQGQEPGWARQASALTLIMPRSQVARAVSKMHPDLQDSIQHATSNLSPFIRPVVLTGHYQLPFLIYMVKSNKGIL